MVKKEDILEALKGVIDPEIGIDVVSLGLVYGVDVSEDGDVNVKMTMTFMGCPLTAMITEDAKYAIQTVKDVKSVNVEIVWDPPWTPDMIDPELRAKLGI
ncbi:MAG: aromatic ring hydroxylase [Mesoaciditoga sp.]|uniref:metal-sulfur cluster assembly factor n=1 Tax=Athalassotoga sp. TaxID=2022597 RepID=UPI000CABA38D|nr:MAG: aromatic ring hydroxylase [Mesoaciditoga sp.]PMP80034.1 MAG: aromatic ring hydroxylase [Mesoaciditoga sp.]HEU24840.1 metal-sulfur cluster assembly factor [Mesoaciditoga lauensis]